MKAVSRSALISVLAAWLAGCMTTPNTSIHQPLTVRPPAREITSPVDGSLYSTNLGQRGMFEDRRARLVGDTMVINLVERTQATKNASSSAKRTSAVSGSIPTMTKVPFANALKDIDVGATTSNDFAGKGASSADNNFTGTIAVTVIDVLPNGNLQVAGEKQVAINQGNEFIRFSGVVNPMHLTASNSVNSTQVADAHIEYRGTGYIDEAQQMGWLARFFQVITPF
jgi:flagellar L-ring protein FlgH